jgi:hypothetical protein
MAGRLGAGRRWLQLILAVVVLVAALEPGYPVSAASPLDWPIPGGHFFTQANGQGGAGGNGYSVVDDPAAPFWTAFQQLGGVDALGYPISQRFTWDGFRVQAFQKVVFQWRPELGQVVFVNVFDRLSASGKDAWLDSVRQTPPPLDTSADTGLAWPDVVARHQELLTADSAIEQRYFADSDPLQHFGLPVAYHDYGNVFVVRTQRAVFQRWKVDVPWARAGQVVIANGGDVAKEAGVFPAAATQPTSAGIATGADRFGVAANGDPTAALGPLGLSWFYRYGQTTPDVASHRVAQISLRPGQASITRVPVATLSAAARANPGGYWLIGNEPNVPGQDNVSPADYVAELKYYADAIKGADPSARLVGPNVLNWDFTCSGCAGITAGHAWVDQFRTAWASQYGGSPPLDVWGIHAYTITWDKLPMTDAPTVEAQVAGFADYLTTVPSEQRKPVWVSEFGIIWAYPGFNSVTSGCAAAPACIAPSGAYATGAVSSFLNDVLGWLSGNAARYRLERWFLYTTYPVPDAYATAFGGVALVDGTAAGGTLSNFGQIYRQYASR